ncbi:MAG: YqgE/AlgH family protein [Verrucomicrobiota bacterium]
MTDPENQEPLEFNSLAGSLLLAHPSLDDPNFCRSVVLISAHSQDDGALGVVINRPMEQSLAQFDGGFSYSELSEVPLYIGGPVASRELILTAWQWRLEEGRFQLHFGVSPDRAKELALQNPDIDLRGFVGYAGWSSGQLEEELEQGSWVVIPVNGGAMDIEDTEDLWRALIGQVSPELRLMAEAPDHPELN